MEANHTPSTIDPYVGDSQLPGHDTAGQRVGTASRDSAGDARDCGDKSSGIQARDTAPLFEYWIHLVGNGHRENLRANIRRIPQEGHLRSHRHGPFWL